jgi:Reverse transcriptase (RNA-dependent DNA polymerase)
VPPPRPKLWQPEDDWTPYGRWAYGHATDKDNNLRLRDPDTFWPDQLIGDQFLTRDKRRLRREQMGIPPIPPHCRAAAKYVPACKQGGRPGEIIPYVPQLPPQPQEEPLGLQPRRSGRNRRPVVCPDNVYGSWNPTQSEQMSNREFRKIIDDVPAPSGSGNRPDSPPHEGKGKKRADYLVNHMVQEGGASLIKFLLRAAVSSAPAKGKIPKVSKVREWHYRDLMRLPKATQEEWKIACKEELEALHRRNVFKLTNLPKGRKTIGCRWVFDIKSDGHRKARLVAQGFSQVEGIDFNELFSPVVHFESV